MKSPLWVQGGKQIGGCRSGSGGTVVLGERENLDLARAVARGWGEMGALGRYLEDRLERGMWERKRQERLLVVPLLYVIDRGVSSLQ